MSKNPKKWWKITDIDGENLRDWRNLNEIFRKNVTYDNIRRHKIPGLHALSGRYIFGKNTGGKTPAF